MSLTGFAKSNNLIENEQDRLAIQNLFPSLSGISNDVALLVNNLRNESLLEVKTTEITADSSVLENNVITIVNTPAEFAVRSNVFSNGDKVDIYHLDIKQNTSLLTIIKSNSIDKFSLSTDGTTAMDLTTLKNLGGVLILKRSDAVFRDHEPHPVQRLTSTGILAVSSNTGSIKIGEMLSNDTLHSYLSKFGIGKSTGSGLPGESAGIFHPVKSWSGTSAPTIAFGHGYSVTAMQATSVFATIANDGVRVSPTVIAGTSDASGNFTPAQSRTSEKVLSTETAAQVRLMMESVVSASGTAPSAAIPGYRVAGKTGTAERYNDNCKCYSGYTASFIGFAPADKPAYVISVTIQNPQGMHWGGALGGPVFKEVMSFVLQSRHISPTNTEIKPVALNEAVLKKNSKFVSKASGR